MGMSIEERQGHIQFEYDGIVVKGAFPATEEQLEKAGEMGDPYAHFECEDERKQTVVRAKWFLYHDERREEMQYRVWRPTDFNHYVRDFITNVLKARIISFREHVPEFDPQKVY